MEQQRVAVGLGLRDRVRPDRPAGPAHVLDDDRLPQALAQALREEAGEKVVVPPAGNGTITRMVRVG